MSEESSYSVRQAPRQAGRAEIADFTLLVRVPGQPAAVRVFTDGQAGEAQRYAQETGGQVLSLPLAPGG